MKYLVLSDSHGQLFYARKAIERWKSSINGIWHLGDCVKDAQVLEKEYRHLDSSKNSISLMKIFLDMQLSTVV